MKNIRKIVLTSFAFLATATVLFAKPISGPKGGRILNDTAPFAEFFVEKDRTVAVTFYDKDLKLLTPGEQVINAIAEASSGKTKLDFEKNAAGFTSKQALPAGDGYMVIVQIRSAAGAKPQNHRVVFHDEPCEECQRVEYACICESHGGEHKAH